VTGWRAMMRWRLTRPACVPRTAAPFCDSISILVHEGPAMRSSAQTTGNFPAMGNIQGSMVHANFPTAGIFPINPRGVRGCAVESQGAVSSD
jgi:hypothetical protein